jgi:hypothetical protein
MIRTGLTHSGDGGAAGAPDPLSLGRRSLQSFVGQGVLVDPGQSGAAASAENNAKH